MRTYCDKKRDAIEASVYDRSYVSGDIYTPKIVELAGKLMNGKLPIALVF